MAKLNSSCIFPKQHILERSVNYTLADTHLEYTHKDLPSLGHQTMCCPQKWGATVRTPSPAEEGIAFTSDRYSPIACLEGLAFPRQCKPLLTFMKDIQDLFQLQRR